MNDSLPMIQLTECKPRFTADVVRRDITIRKESWVLLQNSLNGEHIRLNVTAANWLDDIDGCRTVSEILSDRDADGETAQQFFEALQLLASAGMVDLGSSGEHARLFAQHEVAQSQEKQRKRNPLAIRLALLDPDGWLNGHQYLWSWVFTRRFVALAFVVIAMALYAGVVNYADLRHSWIELADSPAHWWWYGLLFPILKLIHEMAHAVCIKRWGGAVHEAGITFLVFMPVPYVDASDSWLFEKRSQRLITAAAGIIAELLIVSIAMVIWSVVEPGLLRNIAFAAVVLGTLSTLLFNANPLLRFDGYFILQDLLDIPNLGSRANAYYRYLVRRYAFGVQTATTPATAMGERRWLLGYAALALIYRIFITITIALFLAKHFFFLGIALASFALYQLFAKPVIHCFKYLKSGAEISHKRATVVMRCAAAISVVAIAVFLLPMPSSTRAQGVVWVPTQAQVFAGATGLLHTQHVSAGEQVEAGDLLFSLSSPSLVAQYHTALSKRQALSVEHQAARTQDRDKTRQLAIDLASLDAEIERLEQRRAALNIRAQRTGVLALSSNQPIIGKLVKQGDLLAFLVDDTDLVVRAVIDQGAKGQVDRGVVRSTVRLADNFSKPLNSNIIQRVPAANNQLPSPLLAANGNSGIAVASQEGQELKTTERVFHVELSLPVDSLAVGIGGRAYVSLKHQPESLGKRWWRSARQLLLKQITV